MKKNEEENPSPEQIWRDDSRFSKVLMLTMFSLMLIRKTATSGGQLKYLYLFLLLSLFVTMIYELVITIKNRKTD